MWPSSVRFYMFCVCTCVWACGTHVPYNPYDPHAPENVRVKATLMGEVRHNNQPVQQATVSFQTTQGVVLPSVNTDVSGRFVAPGLPAETLKITITAPFLRPLNESVSLLPGETQTLSFILEPLPVSTGTVFGKIFKQNNTHHANIVVEALGTGFRSITNAEGEFDLTAPEGTYTVSFSCPGFRTHTQEHVVFTTGQRTLLQETPLMLEATLGTVQGLAALEGVPSGSFEGVSITLEPSNLTTHTTPNGSFLFDGIPEGIYTLAFSHPSYGTQTLTGIAVQAGAATQVPWVFLTLARGHVTGRVLLQNTTDHKGVELFLEGTSLTTLSLSDGRFAFQYVPVGTYVLRARKAGYMGVSQEITLQDAYTPLVVNMPALEKRPGDFLINDGHPWTRSRTVSLSIQNQPNRGVRVSETPSFNQASWQTWASSMAFTLSEGDGVKNIYVQYQEEDGGLSEVYQANIVLDTTPPSASASFFNTPTSVTRNALLTLHTSASDNLSGVASIAVFPAHQPATQAIPFAPVLQIPTYRLEVSEMKTYHVLLTDQAGNTSTTPLVVNIGYDITPPTLSNLVSACTTGLPVCKHPLAFIRAQSADAVQWAVGYSPFLEEHTFQPFTGTYTAVLEATEGVHLLYVQARDAAGNTSASYPISVGVDTLPPVLQQFTLAGTLHPSATADASHRTATPAVGVQLKADDASEHLTVQYSHNMDFTESSTQPYTGLDDTWFTPRTEGTHTLYVRITDEAGNVTTDARSITLDTTPPYAHVELQTPLLTASQTAVLHMLSTDTETVLIQGDTALQAPFTLPFTWDIDVLLSPQDGVKQWQVQALDDVGNTSEPFIFTCTLDRTAPVLLHAQARGSTSSVPGLSNSPFITVFNTLDATSTDVHNIRIATSNILSLHNGWVPYQPSISYTLPHTEGTHTLWVWVQDRTGNISEPISTTLDLDTQAPHIPVLSLLPGQITQGPWMLALTSPATDAHAVVYTLNVSGAFTWSTSQAPPWSIPFQNGWPYGTYTVSLTAQDVAGNSSSRTWGSVVFNPLQRMPTLTAGMYNSPPASQLVHAEGITAALFAASRTFTTLNTAQPPSIQPLHEVVLDHTPLFLRIFNNTAYITYGANEEAPSYVERIALHKSNPPQLQTPYNGGLAEGRFLDVLPQSAYVLGVYEQEGQWYAGKLAWDCEENCHQPLYTLGSYTHYTHSSVHNNTWVLALQEEGVLVVQNTSLPEPVVTLLNNTHFDDRFPVHTVTTQGYAYIALEGPRPSLAVVDLNTYPPSVVGLQENIDCSHMHLSNTWLVCAGSYQTPSMALIDISTPRTPRMAQQWGYSQSVTYSITGTEKILFRSHTGGPSVEAWTLFY